MGDCEAGRSAATVWEEMVGTRPGLMFCTLIAVAAMLAALAACRRTARSSSAPVTPQTHDSCTPARPHAPGNADETIESGGLTRQYILHVPPAYDGAKPLPLVVNLHGAGSNATQQAFYSGFPQKADQEGFILITPDGAGTPRQWNFLGLKAGADDIGFIRDLLDRIEADLRADASRVYATGISSGGAMSASLACALQDRIAAVAPVSALYYPPGCPTARAVPLIEFHGTDDKIVPFAGGRIGGLPSPNVEEATAAWARADGCDATPQRQQVTEHVRLEAFGGCRGHVAVQLYIVEGGGHTWPGGKADVVLLGVTTHEVSATDLIWQFFASQPRLSY